MHCFFYAPVGRTMHDIGKREGEHILYVEQAGNSNVIHLFPPNPVIYTKTKLAHMNREGLGSLFT